MIFLFEEHLYDSVFLKAVIGYGKGEIKYRSESGFNTEKTNDGIKINGVGYCFYNGQPVFVLPKVFVENETRALGIGIHCKGEDVFGNQLQSADRDQDGDSEGNKSLEFIQRKFLSSLSLWLYSAIDKYNKLGGKNNGVETPPHSESQKFSKNDRYATLLDIMSSMEMFYKKNQTLFVFVAKNKHSGNHKINWQRTVNRKTPFIQNGTPIYMETVNKVKVFDLDDRLLVLYFSAMKFIQDKFGYAMPQSEFYQPLGTNEMERLLENERGLRELKKIKYKYFEDRLLKLYNIMEAFFRWGSRYKNKSNNVQEYLIANSFNNVFEAMIDELIGDPEFDKKKKNADGKVIDHLYKEKSLIFANGESEKIWHIGDSKYYKDPNDIKGQAVAKQFTYAKNIIQDFFSPGYVDNENDNVDLENDFYAGLGKDHHGVRYRDKLTEGYSVTPNFFIRGDVPQFNEAEQHRQYNDPYFCSSSDERNNLITEVENENVDGKNIKDHLWENRNRHFKNRLFDRDTLLLQVYNVNFLYVLKAYTSKYSSLREEFKRDAREKFRKNFLKLLDEKYVFYGMWPKSNLADDAAEEAKTAEQIFVDSHFRDLVGKFFKPKGSKCLILALEKNSTSDEDIVKMLRKIEQDCEMIFRIPVTEIWSDCTRLLPEANLGQAYYDENLHGFFVERQLFENAKIGVEHRLPNSITNRPITGDVHLRVGLPPEFSNWSKDDYYFLPCK